MKKFQVVTATGVKVTIEAEKARWNAESASYVEFLSATNERIAVFAHFQQWMELAEVRNENSEYSSTTKALFESAINAIADIKTLPIGVALEFSSTGSRVPSPDEIAERGDYAFKGVGTGLYDGAKDLQDWIDRVQAVALAKYASALEHVFEMRAPKRDAK